MTVTVHEPSGLERALAHDRALVAIGLAALSLLAWAYLLRMARAMGDSAMAAEMHAAMGMPAMQAWSAADLATLFLMWTVMMVAMMVPSAAPLMFLVLGTYRRRGERARGCSTVFLAGYLAAWAAFSVVASAAQFLLHRAALLSPSMAARSAWLGGAVLVAAGVYQWLPFKATCLARCRSPFSFLTRDWREGMAGAALMGWRHGLFCVGCCWALMAVLFAAGVMNLVWVAAIAALVLIEKAAARGPQAGRLAGAALVAWGIAIVF